LVEHLSAANWNVAFDYFRKTVYSIRSTATPSANSDATSALNEAERSTLIVVRLLSFFWVDASKLGLVIQELCSSYLHFRKAHQSTVAIVLPLLVTRWIDRYPAEFVQLHQRQRKIDGGVDTLFDMTHTVIDSSKRNSLLYPLQASLLLLLPDVFEVASNLREAKSGSVIKKVAFLDGLRKSLRNGNEQAGYCLVFFLRSARHFEIDSDSALVSYVMDVQDEVRDAVFYQHSTVSQPPLFGQDMMTAAFVNLAHFNADDCASLAEICMSSSAPQTFKIAAIQACCYFAQQPNTSVHQDLFRTTLSFVQSQLEADESSPIEPQAHGSGRNTEMVCSILQLFDTSPSFLLEDLGEQPNSGGVLAPFLLCVVSPNDSIRQLASSVAGRLFRSSPEVFRAEKNRRRFGSPEFRRELWARSSKVLLGLYERIARQNGESDLQTLRDYLEARLLLLRNIPVSQARLVDL
jgi:neurofibromin 1